MFKSNPVCFHQPVSFERSWRYLTDHLRELRLRAVIGNPAAVQIINLAAAHLDSGCQAESCKSLAVAVDEWRRAQVN